MSTGKIKVLLIDDSPDLAETYCELLEEAGYQVFSASNCEQALEEMPKKLPIDLILIDHNMPRMSGTECVKEFRKRFPDHHATKLVIFSCHSPDSPIAKCAYEAGADFLEKPTDIFQFIEAVQRLTA